MESVKIKVEGMTCGGCVTSVHNALTQRDGVSTATSDLDSGIVAVEFDPAVIQQPGLQEATIDAGFDVAA